MIPLTVTTNAIWLFFIGRTRNTRLYKMLGYNFVWKPMFWIYSDISLLYFPVTSLCFFFSVQCIHKCFNHQHHECFFIFCKNWFSGRFFANYPDISPDVPDVATTQMVREIFSPSATTWLICFRYIWQDVITDEQKCQFTTFQDFVIYKICSSVIDQTGKRNYENKLYVHQWIV